MSRGTNPRSKRAKCCRCELFTKYVSHKGNITYRTCIFIYFSTKCIVILCISELGVESLVEALREGMVKVRSKITRAPTQLRNTRCASKDCDQRSCFCMDKEYHTSFDNYVSHISRAFLEFKPGERAHRRRPTQNAICFDCIRSLRRSLAPFLGTSRTPWNIISLFNLFSTNAIIIWLPVALFTGMPKIMTWPLLHGDPP